MANFAAPPLFVLQNPWWLPLRHYVQCTYIIYALKNLCIGAYKPFIMQHKELNVLNFTQTQHGVPLKIKKRPSISPNICTIWFHFDHFYFSSNSPFRKSKHALLHCSESQCIFCLKLRVQNYAFYFPAGLETF